MNDFFTLPTNIKQIGSIGDGMRIYMEDYVCTYLDQYARAGGYDERLALLVGRYILIDGQPVLFINGAIQGKHVEESDGLLHFTDKSSSYAESIVGEFFEGMEIVGWMQSQPGYGTFLNQQYAAYHFKEFPKINQVMFVVDPLENINSFYAYNDDRSSLAEARGYFIYYDRNTNMHEYMLSNKATEAEVTTKPVSFVDIPKMERVESPAMAAGAETYYDETSPEEIMRKRQEQRTAKRTAKEHKKTLSLLVSMSAVLFVVCFVLGAGLIQSQNRIGVMETQLIQLSAAYRNLYTQVANPVFAPATAASVAIVEGDSDIVNNDVGEPDTSANISSPADDGNREIDGIPVGPPINMQDPVPAAQAPEPTPQAPAPTPQPPQAQQPVPIARSIPETYTIQPGDSLSAISIYFYGFDRVEDILALNGMDDPNMIISGTTILLP